MNLHFTRRRALAAAMVLALAGPALGQDAWPTKPVRIVVPFAPGGSTDVLARLVGQKLGVLWGQTVVMENRAGAGGNIGADLVAKSPADGYTLLFASGSITINPSLYKKMPFDTRKDLLPITNVAQGPMLVVVQDASPHKTLKDLIAAAKAKPGSINFASAGVGSQVHLASENFADAAGIEIQHVPYKGEALGFNDLIAGQVQMMVGNYSAAAALIGPNRLRALAVTSKQRVPQMPDLPTANEAGLPGFENIGWFGLFAPAGTPSAVVQKVQRDVAQVMAETEVKARLYVQGMTPVVSSTADFTKQVDQELERWAKVVAARKLQAN
ncbi:MAG: tripartite tricarboxylate transporter substrate binding protein [Burkholderiaceae bacterium]|jgi:tripartite-type tricarboxylate transporter receptor subunit TctC|nr:tripartite tricarboxylate transporter substrate binding protein [Burkholderiaceae bacterium]MCU0938889.1 tripartite tricarboxylate transporter substrate binding protein [Burkholderiaceae bacterium]MCU0964319.1 tripartite tricarboxylate transporter substrate binding protein [Burkholderiaceae bacterium]